MVLLEDFELSAGSVPGREHLGSGNLLKGSNNQDAFATFRSSACIIATVHDGCSAGKHSEVGAKLAARIIVGTLEHAVRGGSFSSTDDESIQTDLDHVLKDLLAKFRRLSATIFGDSFSPQLVVDYLLCTTLALVVTRTVTFIFSMGDGYYALNGAISEIGPFENNAPPYFAYQLLKPPVPPAASSHFAIHALTETESLETALIATDGFRDLLRSAYRNIPGKFWQVGAAAQLWLSERFYDSGNGAEKVSEAITPWLRQLNSETTKIAAQEEVRIKRERGLLNDDTTIVVLRRRSGEGTPQNTCGGNMP